MIYIALAILMVGLSFSVTYGKKTKVEMEYDGEILVFLIAAVILLFKGFSS